MVQSSPPEKRIATLAFFCPSPGVVLEEEGREEGRGSKATRARTARRSSRRSVSRQSRSGGVMRGGVSTSMKGRRSEGRGRRVDSRLEGYICSRLLVEQRLGRGHVREWRSRCRMILGLVGTY